jgi:hypothetical protein
MPDANTSSCDLNGGQPCCQAEFAVAFIFSLRRTTLLRSARGFGGGALRGCPRIHTPATKALPALTVGVITSFQRAAVTITADSATVTVKLPFAVRKRGGRKQVFAPDGAPVPPLMPHVDSMLVKAIARAFRWQKMLETSRYATIKEIATAENINPSYVSRVLRLTLLAPATVEAIFDGRTEAAPNSRRGHGTVCRRLVGAKS